LSRAILHFSSKSCAVISQQIQFAILQLESMEKSLAILTTMYSCSDIQLALALDARTDLGDIPVKHALLYAELGVKVTSTLETLQKTLPLMSRAT